MAPLDIYIVTFNCGRNFVDIEALSAGLFKPYGERNSLPDIVVFSLQEIAPIAYAFLGGAYLTPYFSRFLQALNTAAGSRQPYDHVVTRNVGMTGIVIFTKSELTNELKWMQTAGVGVGAMDTGNKGAVGIRLGLQEDDSHQNVTLTFVAAHLAPMEDAFQRRNEDWENIVRGLAFNNVIDSPGLRKREERNDPSQDTVPLLPDQTQGENEASTSMFVPQSPVFFAGDLNYRSSDRPPTPEDYVSYPQPTDDRSSPRHFSHLLEHDQLRREMKAGHTAQGLSEAPINFPPTYKYSPEEVSKHKTSNSSKTANNSSWIWSKHRFPSWCDRILFSSSFSDAIAILSYTALPIMPTSDHRPVALALRLDTDRVVAVGSQRMEPAFQLNPKWQESRVSARRTEIAVGFLTYIGWTWEGNGLALATVLGAVGGWLAITALLST